MRYKFNLLYCGTSLYGRLNKANPNQSQFLIFLLPVYLSIVCRQLAVAPLTVLFWKYHVLLAHMEMFFPTASVNGIRLKSCVIQILALL